MTANPFCPTRRDRTTWARDRAPLSNIWITLPVLKGNIAASLRQALSDDSLLVKFFTTPATILHPSPARFGAVRTCAMPHITVDGKRIECRDRQMILQACL